MASRPIEFPGASGGGWQRTLTGPVKVETDAEGKDKHRVCQSAAESDQS